MANENLTSEYSRFDTEADFAHFRAMIEASLDFEGVPTSTPYSPVGFAERWYRHLPSGNVYRLVEPDGPFRGHWEIVGE